MNRIIRRFFPKGTNFDNVSAAEVAEVAEVAGQLSAPDPGVKNAANAL